MTVVARAPPAFAVAFTVTVPFPRPDAPPVTVSHVVSALDDVHVHAAPVATLNDAVPPPDGIVALDGETT